MVAAPKTKSYRVLIGISYPPANGGIEKHAEPGDIVDNLPPGCVEWMLADEVIEEA